MNYKLIIHLRLEEEIHDQALYYQDQFHSGINDFIDETYHRIIPFLFSYPQVEELDDPFVRAIHVQADKRRQNYAKDFPSIFKEGVRNDATLFDNQKALKTRC